jgi:hypothetical protein
MKTNRRNFLKLAGVTGAALISGGHTNPHPYENNIKFSSPIDGDMLNQSDGAVVEGCLNIPVKIQAPAGSKIKINGIDAKYRENLFLADVPLRSYKNLLEVVDSNTGNKQSICVFWLKNYSGNYRLSLDDNIWFLQDISKNSDSYRSIFENPYLGFFRQIHNTYGTKVHINIYYQTDGFNLSQMTAKFKNEWRENSRWLKLSFHALQNDPDNPYIKAGYSVVKKDCEMVMEQIRRFAGEELLGPVTTLHWGEATIEGSRALRDAGYLAQVSDFVVKDGVQSISMYLDLPQSKHMNERFIWRDNREGIILSRISIVINSHRVEEIVPFLNELKKDPHKSAYIDLLMHEQYFYPFYRAYQPDFREKVTAAVKWADDNKYKPAFLSECIFG